MFQAQNMIANNHVVSKAIFRETTNYDDVYIRPYETRYDSFLSNAINDVTSGGIDTSSGALTDVANQFLRPRTQVNTTTDLARIDNGFSTKRMSFMIRIDSTDGMDAGVTYILTGFTDHPGVSYMGQEPSLDPNMKLYFNNIYTLRNQSIHTPHGRQRQTVIADSNQFLINPAIEYSQYTNNTFNQNNNQLYGLRPRDVFTSLSTSESDPGFSQLPHDNIIIDTRNSIDGVQLSKRTNLSRSRYLNRTIGSFKAATSDAMEDADGLETGIFTQSRHREAVTESPLASQKVLSKLLTNTEFRTQGFVTYSQMCLQFPEFDDRVMVPEFNQSHWSTEYQRGQGASLSQPTPEAIAATIIHQSVPAIMSDLMITRFTFTANNELGNHDIMPTSDPVGFVEGLDYTNNIMTVMDRIKREILQDISFNNEQLYYIDVSIDLVYDSKIHISLNGEPPVFYAIPSFCDGLFTPVVSTDANHVGVVAKDIETMLYDINGDLGRMANESNGILTSANNYQSQSPDTFHGFGLSNDNDII